MDTASMIAGVALAAGAGSRLRPITDSIPKPCCEVAARPLLDLALDRLATVTQDLAVNAHHGAEQIAAVVGDRAIVRVERPEALGTAGALGNLRDWLDGRAAVVVNADTWCPGDLEPLVARWDGARTRVLVPGGGRFGPGSAVVGTLLPWRVVRDLRPTPSGLYELVWRDEQASDRLEVVAHEGPWVDCGTPRRLHDANMTALAGSSVIADGARVSGAVSQSAVGRGAIVAGSLVRSVVFAGARVDGREHLVDTIRWTDGRRQLSISVGGEPPR